MEQEGGKTHIFAQLDRIPSPPGQQDPIPRLDADGLHLAAAILAWRARADGDDGGLW